MVEEHFKKVKELYHEMQKAYKKYVDLQDSFYEISGGMKWNDMPREKGRALGLDDMMENIETQYNYYLQCKDRYTKERQRVQCDINKLSDAIHKLIIEYAFIDADDDKVILKNLKKYHRIDYSYSYFRKIKQIAIDEFEKVLKEQKGTKKNNIEQHT